MRRRASSAGVGRASRANRRTEGRVSWRGVPRSSRAFHNTSMTQFAPRSATNATRTAKTATARPQARVGEAAAAPAAHEVDDQRRRRRPSTTIPPALRPPVTSSMTRPPMNEPARPMRIVMPMLIGSGPGSARRASAPTMRPETARTIEVDEQAHAGTVAPRAGDGAAVTPSPLGAPQRLHPTTRSAMRHLGMHMRIGLAAAFACCARGAGARDGVRPTSPTCCPRSRRPAPTTSPASPRRRIPRPSSSCTAPSRARPTTGRPPRRSSRPPATASSRSSTATAAPATSPPRPASSQRFVDAVLGRHRRAQGLDGRATRRAG